MDESIRTPATLTFEVFEETPLNGCILNFSHEGFGRWSDHTVLYSDLITAAYPPTQENIYHDEKELWPVYDMVINEKGLPPIVFSADHNRLLHYMVTQMQPDQRTLINLDHHDDWDLGFTKPGEIYIGNWVKYGQELGYWNKYVLVRDYSYNNPGREHAPDGFEVSTPDDLDKSDNFLSWAIGENRSYILSIDADMFRRSFIEYRLNLTNPDLAESIARIRGKKGINYMENLTFLKKLMEKVRHDDRCQLIFFTCSPQYCEAENAQQVWETVRQSLMETHETEGQAAA